MNKLLLCLALLIPSAGSAQPTGHNTGMPFGRIQQADVTHLQAYATTLRVDLLGDMKRAYEQDDEALARVFAFSLHFSELNRDARTYGQLIYSSFLNLAERYGIERYSELVAAQPIAVRQRIRDFIYYDATLAPKKTRKDVEASSRKSAPRLFPPDYVFGSGNPLFK